MRHILTNENNIAHFQSIMENVIVHITTPGSAYVWPRRFSGHETEAATSGSLALILMANNYGLRHCEST